MTSHELILISGLAALVSGLPAALYHQRSQAAQRISTLVLVAANATGLVAVYRWWMDGPCDPLRLPSPIADVHVSLAIDGLSAFFLMPVLVVTTLASIFGIQYWNQSHHTDNGRRLTLFFGMMTGAMTLLVVAHDGLMFLAAWETMAISAFFLVATEDQIVETRQAAWLFIAASHFATLCIFGVFALLYAVNGSWEFARLHQTGTALTTALAVLAFLGFGTKAGIMPMHVWLPSAHAQAPSHVSAVLSGVLLKMGIYGLVRVSTFYAEIPLSWGLWVLAMGTLSAVLGVAFAVGQHDMKRLLAYHSIENIGIIVMGLGLALVGHAVHRPVWVMLGLCGGMLHVWNHALFKSLLFLGAGSVIHSVGTRQLDVLGGVSRRMPWTANCFLIGAVAICGLPPLNGFVSELLIYLGLFSVATAPAVTAATAVVFAAPALALVGALAIACFVKVYGTVFLGAPRSEAAANAREAGPVMVMPMIALAGCCAVLGMAPAVAVPWLDRLATDWAGTAIGLLPLATVAPVWAVSVIAALLVSLLLVGLAYLWIRGTGRAPTTVTWDCGYAAPSVRMQYSSSSFAEMLVSLFAWALQPVVHRPQIRELFPADAQFESHVEDTVLRRVIWPMTHAVTWLLAWGRYLQQGSLQAYLLYILSILVFLLLWR